MGQIKTPGQKPAVITLKAVAQHIGLTPGTVSAVLNDSPSARSIPQETKNRIHAAAKELNYRPNFFARTLRNKRTYTIGVIAEEIGDSYSSPIISGIEQDLTVQIDTDDPTPMLGYPFAKQLLARGKPFTAVFAYNDMSAIGAIRALQEQGLRVPQDVSVMGFDDIPGAAFYTPSLTTVRQPLNRMGEVAAQSLLERIEGKKDYPSEIAIEPELVVRESTAKAPGSS